MDKIQEKAYFNIGNSEYYEEPSGSGTLRAIQMFFIHLSNFGVHELTTLEQTQLDAKAEAEAGLRAEGVK